MKKAIIIILAIIVVPFATNAQGVGLGLKAGANFANQSITDASPSSITSFHGGAYLNLNFSESFGITPELLFSSQGSKEDGFKVKTDYVSIPLMLRYKPVSLISLQAGPVFSLLTTAKWEGVDIKDQLKNNDFGLALGAGLHLPMGFNGGLRYVIGFANISDVADQEVKNKTFQVYVGWTLFGAN